MDLNASGNISIGSTASATNQFFLGRQDVFSNTARTFVLFRGPVSASDTTFNPTSGAATFIEIGSNSTAGDGNATFQPNTGSATYTSLSVNDYVSQTGSATGAVSMLDLNMGGNINGPLYGVRVLNPNAQSGFAIGAPTAKVQIGAGSAAAGSAPLKLTAGTIMTTPENGAIEFDGTDLYLTENTSRYKLAKILGGQKTTDFGGISLNGFESVTSTLTVAGAQPGDVVNVNASGASNSVSLIITAYITSTNTVTLRAYNASPNDVTIASDTYKVRVIK